MVAAGERPFQRQYLINIILYQSREILQFGKADIGEIAALLFGVAYRECHSLMRIAERQTFLDQIICQIGRGGIALQRGAAHGFWFDCDAGNHVGIDAQCLRQGVHGVEQRLLVFLVVFVVGQRLTLHQREQGDQMAVYTAGLAAHQFRYVGVLLLRHDGRAGAEAVGDVDEADHRAHPQDQFFGESRQMRHDECGTGGEFDGKITIRNGIQRVFTHAFETQQIGDALALDRIAGAGQCRRAQRQAVDTLATVDEALRVTLEHFVIRHQMMRETNRLCDLQVRESGHDGPGVLFGQIKDRYLQIID